MRQAPTSPTSEWLVSGECGSIVLGPLGSGKPVLLGRMAPGMRNNLFSPAKYADSERRPVTISGQQDEMSDVHTRNLSMSPLMSMIRLMPSYTRNASYDQPTHGSHKI